MAEYIIKSRAVFDGRADSCKPLAVWIKDDRIKKLLPYDETNAVPADVPIYDMGDKLVMPSFIDALPDKQTAERCIKLLSSLESLIESNISLCSKFFQQKEYLLRQMFI